MNKWRWDPLDTYKILMGINNVINFMFQSRGHELNTMSRVISVLEGCVVIILIFLFL